MCSYVTETLTVEGSGKGREGWFAVREVMVSFDHPVHAAPEHTLNLDFLNRDVGPAARVAVELDEASARALADAIVAVLASRQAELA